MDLKFCKDCKHYKKDSGPFWIWLFTKQGHEFAKCHRPYDTFTPQAAEVFMISGNPAHYRKQNTYCSTQRALSNLCGIEAKYFEPK